MKKKDPPGYPGDEAVNQAIREAVREICLEKGLSLEEADGLLRKPNQEDAQALVPRALGIVMATPRKTENVSSAIEPGFWIVCALHRNR